jgi:hypothetical protein
VHEADEGGCVEVLVRGLVVLNRGVWKGSVCRLSRGGVGYPSVERESGVIPSFTATVVVANWPWFCSFLRLLFLSVCTYIHVHTRLLS